MKPEMGLGLQVDRMQHQNWELREENKRLQRELAKNQASVIICPYCRGVFYVADFHTHGENCSKHPLFAALKRIEGLQEHLAAWDRSYSAENRTVIVQSKEIATLEQHIAALQILREEEGVTLESLCRTCVNKADCATQCHARNRPLCRNWRGIREVKPEPEKTCQNCGHYGTCWKMTHDRCSAWVVK